MHVALDSTNARKQRFPFPSSSDARTCKSLTLRGCTQTSLINGRLPHFSGKLKLLVDRIGCPWHKRLEQIETRATVRPDRTDLLWRLRDAVLTRSHGLVLLHIWFRRVQDLPPDGAPGPDVLACLHVGRNCCVVVSVSTPYRLSGSSTPAVSGEVRTEVLSDQAHDPAVEVAELWRNRIVQVPKRCQLNSRRPGTDILEESNSGNHRR